MLQGKLSEDQKDWDLQLQPCMMAYRSSVHESTGETPNLLMVGRQVEVPLDVVTEPTPDVEPLETEYAQALQEGLASPHEVVRRHLGLAAERQKRNYDKRVSSKPFKVGDSVWLHNIKRRKGRNPKLDCPWEGLYLKVSVLSDVTYRIQKSPRAKRKVIHSDRLKPYLGPVLRNWIGNESIDHPNVCQDDADGPESADKAGGSDAEIPIKFVADTDTGINYPKVRTGIPVKFVADSDTLTCTAARTFEHT